MRVVIGEDETRLREGLALVIEQGGFHGVASAADAGSLVSEVSRHDPDLVITDIRMPPDHTDEGLRAALRIRRTMPWIAIVVLSQYERAVIQHVSHIYDQLGLPVSEDDHRRVLTVIRYLSGERPIR